MSKARVRSSGDITRVRGSRIDRALEGEALRRISNVEAELSHLSTVVAGKWWKVAGTPGEKVSDREKVLPVYLRVVEVFGSAQKAERWLTTSIRSLGDRAPVDLMDTKEGRQLVLDTLGRIEHGIAG